MPASQLSSATDPRGANQLQEVSNKLNAGPSNIEVSQAMDPRIFDAVPEQHLKEINRLSKLAGAQLSFHAPIVEPSGYSRDGWSEAERRQVETQMNSFIERAHKLDPKGNINVTFHTSAQLPDAEEKMKVPGTNKEKTVAAYIVDSRTGKVDSVIRDTPRYFPVAGGNKEFNVQKEIERRNEDMWSGTLSNLNFSALRADEIVNDALEPFRRTNVPIPEEAKDEFAGKPNPMLETYEYIKKHEDVLDRLPEEVREVYVHSTKRLDQAVPFLRDAYSNLRELYDRVYQETQEGSDERKKLDNFKNQITPKVNESIEKDPKRLLEFSEMIDQGVKVLSGIKPKIFIPFNDFLVKKTSDTFANVALKSYQQFGSSAPIISIENPPAGQALSRASDLKLVIEESRKKFVDLAVGKGMSRDKAEVAAEKMIGATWDVGHINLIRKQGYGNADLIKEAETIAPFLKHVHLSDNFGGEHTELPMGMGNVPIKGIFEKFKEAGVMDKVKKVSETGDWYQHFKTNPADIQLEAFGSPMYTGAAAPYWNTRRQTMGEYYSGMGTIFPEQHFNMYGSSFSSLPMELGGQMPGAKSRSSGTPTD